MQFIKTCPGASVAERYYCCAVFRNSRHMGGLRVVPKNASAYDIKKGDASAQGRAVCNPRACVRGNRRAQCRYTLRYSLSLQVRLVDVNEIRAVRARAAAKWQHHHGGQTISADSL